MSETKWTPGPHYVGAMNDALFVLAQPPSPAGTDLPPDTPHSRQKVLAAVGNDDVSFEESVANAQLYASASELYGACQTVIEFLDGLENCGEDDPLWAIRRRVHAPLRAVLGPAVAKARGEA